MSKFLINHILYSKSHQQKQMRYKDRIDQLQNEVEDLTNSVLRWQYKLRDEWITKGLNYADEIKRIKATIIQKENEINSLSRIQPFSHFDIADKNFGFYFWHLDCMPTSLVVEKRFHYDQSSLIPAKAVVEEETERLYTADSEWFIIDDLQNLNSLFEVISVNSIDSALVNGILKIIERISIKINEPPRYEIKYKACENGVKKAPTFSHMSVDATKVISPDLYELGLSYSANNMKKMNVDHKTRKLETVESKLNEIDASNQQMHTDLMLLQVNIT
jgi:hypothetical protein